MIENKCQKSFMSVTPKFIRKRSSELFLTSWRSSFGKKSADGTCLRTYQILAVRRSASKSSFALLGTSTLGFLCEREEIARKVSFGTKDLLSHFERKSIHPAYNAH